MNAQDFIIGFVIGTFAGAIIGVVIMCCLQINHGEIDLGESEPKGR